MEVKLPPDAFSTLAIANAVNFDFASSSMLWGCNGQDIFQVNVSSLESSVTQILNRDDDLMYGGSSVAFDGTYYVASSASIYAFNNEIPFDFTTPIIQTGEFFLPGLEGNERIVDIALIEAQSEHAALIAVTTRGKMVSMSLDFTKVSDILHLPGVDSVTFPEYFVSNAMISDGAQSGVYVVTSASLTRVQWDNEEMSLKLSWSTCYANGANGDDGWLWGRVSPGSGSSPRLIGPTDTPDFVVTTLGSSPSELLFFDTRTGSVIASHPVRFGHGNKSDMSHSAVDQPAFVYGNRVVVANNWVTQSPPALCSAWMYNNKEMPLHRKELCPFLMGDFSKGIEQFEIDPLTREVRSVWSNPDVSCSSSAPVLPLAIGESNPIMFCVGKRQIDRSKFSASTYSLEAINWTTGESLFYIPLSSSSAHNCLFAGLGTTMYQHENALVLAALGGLYRIWNIKCDMDSPHSPHELISGPVQEISAIDILDELAVLYNAGDVPSVDISREFGI